jgi:hypothetical protein
MTDGYIIAMGFLGILASVVIIILVIAFNDGRVNRGGYWQWQKKPEAGTSRRKKKFIFWGTTFDGVTKRWCRAEVVQMWSAGGMVAMCYIEPPGWITLGWGETIESVGHTDPKGSILWPGNAMQAEIVVKKKEGGAIVWKEQKVKT